MTVNIEAILIGLFSVAHTPEQAEHAAREVLRQHAHELAGQQRAWARERQEALAGNAWDQVHDAINHIDPEVQP